MVLNEILNEPVPMATSTYAPVAHGAIHSKIIECVNKNGFEIIDTFAKGKNPNSCIVNYTLKDNERKYDLSNEMGIRIGWKNSYNKTVSFGFAIGSEVFICTNGMVRGEYTIKKQHRQRDLQNYVTDLIEEYFGNIRETHNENVELAKHLMSKEVFEDDAREIIGQLFIDNKILSTRQLRVMSNELYNSTKFHNFNECETITAWDLYNHGTEALKLSPVINDFAKHEEYNKFFIAKF